MFNLTDYADVKRLLGELTDEIARLTGLGGKSREHAIDLGIEAVGKQREQFVPNAVAREARVGDLRAARLIHKERATEPRERLIAFEEATIHTQCP